MIDIEQIQALGMTKFNLMMTQFMKTYLKTEDKVKLLNKKNLNKRLKCFQQKLDFQYSLPLR